MATRPKYMWRCGGSLSAVRSVNAGRLGIVTAVKDALCRQPLGRRRSEPPERVNKFLSRDFGYRSAVRAVHARTWLSESRTDWQYGQQCLRLEGGHEDVTHPKPLQERHFPHTVARSVTRPHKESCSSHRVYVEHLAAP